MANPEHSAPKFIRNSARQSGFSLAEVTLSIGIMAFAIIAIVGLLPAGMGVFRRAIDTSVSSQIIQRVLSDTQETDFSQLIAGATGAANQTFRATNSLDPAKGAVRWFDDQGNELSAPAGAIYHVNTRILPVTGLPSTVTGTNDNPNLATVTVQVANNPGNQELAIDTDASLPNLWSGAYKSGANKVVSIVTSSGVVARN